GSQKTVPVVNGTITTSLVASDNAGYVYNVLLMSGGEASNSTWRVPAGSAVTQLSQLVAPPPVSPTGYDPAGAAAAAVAAIPNASATTTGLLSKTDWAAFTTKQSPLGFTPANPANNLSEYATNAATVRTNLGLGSASTHPVSDFDAAGAATAAQAAAIAASDPAGAATTAQANAISSSVQKSAFAPTQLLGVTSSGAPFVDLSDPALSTWFAALRNANTQVVNIAILGDSIAQGLGTVSNGGKFYNSWAQQLALHLHTLFGNGGSGIIPVYYGVGAWTQTGTWTDGGSNLGPLQTGLSPFNHLYSATGTSNNLALMAMDGDKVNVYTESAPDSGACTVSIDGTVAGSTPATTSATLQAVKTTFAASSFGSHALTITPTATGKCYVYGAEWTIGSTGVRIHNLAVAGARSEAFGASPTTQNAFLSVIPGGVQLAIVSLGVNDFHAGNNEALSTYTSNMQNLLTYVAGLTSPSPSVLVLDENQPNTVNQTPAVNAQFTWPQLVSAEQSLAVSNNAAFISMSELWGSYASANTLGLMASDGVHPSDKGHLYYNYVLEHRLFKGTPPLLMGDTGAGNMATQYSQFLSPSSTFGGVPGHYNTTFGVKAGYAVTGDKNTFFGNGSGQGFTTGSSNTAIGAFACQSPTLTGSNLTCLGAGAQMASGMANAAQIGPGTNSVNGTMQWWGWNIADAYGNLSANLVKRTVGTAIASAATIAPTSGLTHVTGTTAISTITVPSITVSGTAFTGCLVLIPDGAWTTTTTGNIAAASTAVVGRQMEMCYDGSKWYPNY
ncbi:MAG TPA: SGNH/GDSL hydrolase family protein, partial [Candidatus Dormibacteraeota bacterium]|nr:SGNH/GDSL hydrolase family protein [Candidatus Dormibacteraeota bacterium]